MISDKKIKSIMQTVLLKTQNYLNHINSMNECASTDRLLESIIQDVKRVEKIHNSRFKNKNMERN